MQVQVKAELGICWSSCPSLGHGSRSPTFVQSRDSDLRPCTDHNADDIHTSTSLSNSACYSNWISGDAEDMSCGVDRNMSGRTRELHDFPPMKQLTYNKVRGKPALGGPMSESSLRRTTPSSQDAGYHGAFRGSRLCLETEKTCVGADPH